MNVTKKKSHSGREAAAREEMERLAKAHDEKLQRAEDKRVDVGSEQSFPASDPPAYMGGAAIAGAPGRRKGEKSRARRAERVHPSPPLAPEEERERKAHGHDKRR